MMRTQQVAQTRRGRIAVGVLGLLYGFNHRARLKGRHTSSLTQSLVVDICDSGYIDAVCRWLTGQ